MLRRLIWIDPQSRIFNTTSDSLLTEETCYIQPACRWHLLDDFTGGAGSVEELGFKRKGVFDVHMCCKGVDEIHTKKAFLHVSMQGM